MLEVSSSCECVCVYISFLISFLDALTYTLLGSFCLEAHQLQMISNQVT